MIKLASKLEKNNKKEIYDILVNFLDDEDYANYKDILANISGLQETSTMDQMIGGFSLEPFFLTSN